MLITWILSKDINNLSQNIDLKITVLIQNHCIAPDLVHSNRPLNIAMVC